MRYSSVCFVLALPLMAATAVACRGKPVPSSQVAIIGDDGSWSASVAPEGIVFRRLTGANQDSLVFDYSSPHDDGVVRRYTSVRIAADTHRVDIGLSTAPCVDARGVIYPQRAKVWIDQVVHDGCAVPSASPTQ